MGLSLKLSLFYQADPDWVYQCYRTFYARRGVQLQSTGEPGYDHAVHMPDGGWTTLFQGVGWDWQERREAQRFVSMSVGCLSLLVFVYDGDYWGYELMKEGKVLDQFVQHPSPEDGTNWFPGCDTSGNPALLAEQLDWLTRSEVAAYLVRFPKLDGDPLGRGDVRTRYNAYRAERDRLNVKARASDQFARFDECAALDFLRLLHVGVEVRPTPDWPRGVVGLTVPVRLRFWTPRRRPAEEQPRSQ